MGEVNLVEAKTALPKIGNILKKCMTGQYILVFIFLIIILSLPGFSSTSTTQITTSTNSFATNTLFRDIRQGIASSNGNYVLFYWDGLLVKYTVSTNNGNTWATSVSIPISTYSQPTEFEVIADNSNNNGNFYVAYSIGDYHQVNVQFQKFTWNGSGYDMGAFVLLNGVSDRSSTTIYWPHSIMQDKNNNIWIAERLSNNYLNQSIVSVFVRVSTTDGVTWSANSPLSASTTLNGGIDQFATVMTVNSTTGFETGNSANTLLWIDNEWIGYTATTGGTIFTNCTRSLFSPSAVLSGQISAAATTITATTNVTTLGESGFVDGFGSNGYINIDGEIITYTGVSSDGKQFLGCTRGAHTVVATLAATIDTVMTTISVTGSLINAGFHYPNGAIYRWK